MNRREFISFVGVGGVASCLPVAIAACSSETQPPVRPDGFREIGTITELNQKGHLLNKQIKNAPVLVVRNPENAEMLLAVNPTCTHRGCVVEWKAEQEDFVCPCHHAVFAADGNVKQKPAREPLKVYEVKLEQDKVLIAPKQSA